jgi:hypothetical protein
MENRTLVMYLQYALFWPRGQPFLFWGGERDKTVIDPKKESKKNDPDNKEPKSDGSRGLTK